MRKKTFKQTRELINRLLETNFETNLDRVNFNKSIAVLPEHQISFHHDYSFNYCRLLFHSDPDESDFLIIPFYEDNELKKVELKFEKFHRILNVNIRQKIHNFEYRKSKEEKTFYKEFFRQILIMVKFPFLKRYNFVKRVPKIVKPLGYDPRLARKRMRYPIMININYLIFSPHNGLRPRKRRKL